MSYEYTVSVPEKERASFRLIAKKMGWKARPANRKSGIEKAMEDIKAGRVYAADSAEDMIAQILG